MEVGLNQIRIFVPKMSQVIVLTAEQTGTTQVYLRQVSGGGTPYRERRGDLGRCLHPLGDFNNFWAKNSLFSAILITFRTFL